MRKINLYILFISAILLIIGASCTENRTSYIVSGKLENVQDSIFFAARETGDSLFVDTIRINKKGEFTFEGVVDTLTVISLYFKENTVSPYILVDKGWKVEVKGDIKKADLILAKGGDINDDLTQFKNENIELLKSRNRLMNHKEGVGEKIDSVASKEFVVELKNTNFELLNIASAYVKNNPSKIASVILINNFFKNEESLERLNDALDELTGVAYDFPLAVQLREYRDNIKKSAVGFPSPFFSLKDIDGKKVSLNDFRGKYVLLSFVSTTCDVCEDIRPQMIKEYNGLKKEKMNIEFISIVKDVEEKPLSKDIRKSTKWITIPEYGGWSSKVFEDFNIKELPYSILIGKDGKILERNVSGFNLKNRLEGYPDIRK